MKTTTTNPNFSNLSEDTSEGIIKAIALLIHLDEPFFIAQDGEVYQGNEEDARESYDAEYPDADEPRPTFEEWLCDNCDAIDEYEDDDNYMVLTGEEADEKCKEYILDSVWAFNADFLSGETGIDSDVFKAIQDNGRRESNNDAILSCIKDEDSFVDAAISADGRGHFLSMYDGKEDEVQVDSFGTFYIYRTN